MKKILTALFVLAILIQFFPIDKTNPPLNKGMDFLTVKKTPQALAAQIRKSCYDCHSNESIYPWYTNIQPAGWFLKNHINDGRKHLNFSLYSTYEPKRQSEKMDEAAELIQNGEMPLESYTLIHDDARLSTDMKKQLIAYFKKIGEDTRLSNGISAKKEKQED